MSLGSHTMFVKSDGTVWGCGCNDHGQLGLGHINNPISKITKIPISDVKYVFTGQYQTMFVKKDGTVWGCGRNGNRQLGLEGSNDFNKIIQIPINNVKKIAFTNSSSIFLKEDGTVWGCGSNSYGELGIGSQSEVQSIEKLPMNDVKNIYCGYNHIMFIKKDGTVWGCGSNRDNQISDNSIETIITTPKEFPIKNVMDVVCCSSYSLFVKNDGTVWGCGRNDHGQLGLGHNESPIKVPEKLLIENVYQIKGYTHTLFLKKDGTVWGCGYNNSGQLASDDLSDVLNIKQLDIDNVSDVYVGLAYSVFLKNDLTVYSNGLNHQMQLGTSESDQFYTTIKKIDIDGVNKINDQVNKLLHFIKDKDIYKSINDKGIYDIGSSLPNEIRKYAILDINDILKIDGSGKRIIDTLSDEFTIMSISEDELTTLIYTTNSKSTIVIPKKDIDIKDFLRLLKVELITNNKNGIVKIACSFDKGVTWETIKNNNWTVINLDDISLKNEGIDSESVGTLHESFWERTMDISSLRIAYYIENFESGDGIGIDTLKITGELTGYWKRAKNNEDYKYVYNSNTSLTVSLLKNGTYKINYYKS